jgi:uncharacterized membrane protein YkvA (DUF1232 family)
MQGWFDGWKTWAASVRRDCVALYFAARDPRVPLRAKALAALIAAYALSPIDLIPDFIPVLGYLDDLVLLPVAIAGVMRLIEPRVLAEHRAHAIQISERPVSKVAGAVIIGLWLAAVILLACWLWLRLVRLP